MRWRTLLFLAVSVAVAGTLSAQTATDTQTQPMAQAPSQDMGQTLSLTGTVVSVSADTLVLDTDSGRQTFMVDTQSTLPAGLAVGNRISIDYHNMGGGRLHAATVNMLGATDSGLPATGTATTGTTEPAPTTGVETTAPTTDTTTTTTTTTTGTPVVGMDNLQTLNGKVVSSSGTELVITTDSGDRTFMVDEKSRVPTGLIAGKEVTVEYHTLDGGRFHAANVTTIGAGTQVASAELPSTASELPLIGLAGLLALAAGMAVRTFRRLA